MFSNLKVRSCIIGVLALFLVAIAATCGLSIWNAQRAHAKLENVNDVYSNQITELDQATIQALRAAAVLNTLFIQWQSGEAGDLSRGVAVATQGVQASRQRYKNYADAPKSSADAKITENVGKAYASYVAVIDRMAAAVAARNVSDFSRASNQAGAARDTFSAAADAFNGEIDSVTDLLVVQAQTEFERARLIMFAVLAAVFLLAVACWIFISRMVLGPLRLAGAHFDRIALGDLTGHVDVRSKNEIGALFAAIKRMQESLTTTIAQVRLGVDEINLGTREISSGNTNLSSRTEQQAASLEETAATMEELASTVKQNADNARQANKLAASASDVAERGGDAVSEVVQTMDAISTSSRKIAEIVGVIDSIAFQTNILALNAAVEAARAGEQGKGFAVVAAEVRTLAQRSAQAAKEIKGLIEDSSNKVGVGSHQVEQAGATMKEIVASVKRVTDIMGEIAAASEEQSNGIDQVNKAVTQMDDVTQQNAALVEQAAAASGALQGQAEALAEAVAVFKIDQMQEDGRNHTAAAASHERQTNAANGYARGADGAARSGSGLGASSVRQSAGRRSTTAAQRASSAEAPERASVLERPIAALPAPAVSSASTSAATSASREARTAARSAASGNGVSGGSAQVSASGKPSPSLRTPATPRNAATPQPGAIQARTGSAARSTRVPSSAPATPTRTLKSTAELRREIRPAGPSDHSLPQADAGAHSAPSASAISAAPPARRRTSTTQGTAPSSPSATSSKASQPINDDDWESF